MGRARFCRLLAQVQVVVHRLSSTLQSACKVRSEESVTQEGLRSRYGAVTLCMRRIMNGGRGDESVVPAGRRSGSTTWNTQLLAQSQPLAAINPAPPDHEYLPRISREVGGASLLLNECPPALRWQLLPDVAVEEAREGAGADPLHADAVAETEWERARTYFEAQDDLQVALQTALPKWAGQLPFDDGACLPDPPTVATSDVRGAVGAQASSLGESLGQGASTENPASGLPDGPDAGGAAAPQAAVVEHAEASVEHGGHSELILQGHEKLQLGFLDGALVRAGMEGCVEAQSSDTAAHIVALEVPHTTSGTPSLLPARLWLAPTDGGTERPLELPFRGALPPTTALHFKAGDPASLGGVLGMSVMVKHLPSSTAVVVRGRLGSMLPEGPGQASIIVDVPPHPSGQPFKGLQSSPPARWNTSNHRLLWKLQDLAADVEFSAKAKLAVEQASQDPASAATHAPWRGRFQFSSQQVPGALSALGLTLEASDQGSLRWQHSVELVAVGKVSVTG